MTTPSTYKAHQFPHTQAEVLGYGTKPQQILPKVSFMTNRYLSFILFACLLLGISPAMAQKAARDPHTDPAILSLLKNYEKKIYFTQNKGQWPGHVLYRADFPMGQALATREGMMVGTFDPKSLDAFNDQAERREVAQQAHRPFTEKQAELKGHGWLMKFQNASPDMYIADKDAHSDVFNYFIGDDVSKHATDVHSFNEVWYNNVYKNTDVRYYPSQHGTLEYDIICKPGSDPNEIVLDFAGIEKKHVDFNGNLILHTSVGDMEIAPPVAYQIIDGRETKVEVAYVLNEKGMLTFKLGKYDASQTLVIDPIALVWATWASNNASTNSHGHGIHVDPSTGEIYIVGWYNNTGLITQNPFQATNAGGQDMILGKYKEPATVGGAGTRIWQTYLGGNGSDNPYAIDQGPDGNIYVTGIIPATSGTAYPMIGGTAFGVTASTLDNRTETGNNVYITKINPAGNSIKSCVVGGNGSESIYDIRITSNGDILVCGISQSNNWLTLHPGSGATNTLNGTQDVLVFKVTQDLNSLLWMSNIGGSATEQANIMLTEPTTGDIYVAGTTTSNNFPTLSPRQGTFAGASAGFVMKMNGNGVTKWSSYFNSAASQNTSILCMEFNTTRDRLVFGGLTSGLATANISSSGVFQTAYAGGTRDFFVTSMDTSQTFNWSTYLGGNGNEVNMMGLNLDLNNDVYIFGYTNGSFPTAGGPFEATKPGADDKVFTKMAANGSSLIYSTYYGTSGSETDPVGERGIKFNDCRIYTIVTSNNNALPLTQGAITTNKVSGGSVLEMGIVEWGSPPPLTNNTVVGNQVVCSGDTASGITGTVPAYNLPNITRNGVISAHPSLGSPGSYQWQRSLDGGTTWTNIAGATAANLPTNLVGPITSEVRIRRIINGDLCVVSTDNNIITLNVFGINPTITPACIGQNNGGITTSLTGGVAPFTYLWSTGATTPNLSPVAPGTYTVTVTDGTGCTATSTITVTEYAEANISGSYNFCPGGSTTLTAMPAGASYLWNTGATTQSISVNSPGTYSVTITFAQGCTQSSSAVATQVTAPAITTVEISGITNNDGTLCAGETATLFATPGPIYSWNTGAITQSITVSTAGTYTVAVSGGSCPGTTSTTVTVSPLPTPAITGDPLICAAETTVLTATGGGTYLWTPGNANTAAINVNTPGTYQVRVTSAAGCVANASRVVATENCVPVANPNTFTVLEDAAATNLNVLANDNFGGDGPSTGAITLVTTPANGTATVNNNGTPNNPTDDYVVFTPDANFNGSTNFIYRICDSNADCDTALVTINVTAVNDPPIVNGNTATTVEDTPVPITVLTNDSDLETAMNPATVTVTSAPANGTTSVNPVTGVITYTPNPNFTGTDSFIYQACDSGTPLPALCDTALVTVTVTPVNDPPVARPDNVSTNEDTPVVINILSNDSDVEGPLNIGSVTMVTPPTHGTYTVNPTTGAVTYTPNSNYNGPDSFIYQVCDNGTPLPALCDTAIVRITVNPVNDPPIVNGNTATTVEDTPVPITVLNNDSDVETAMNPATVTVTSAPANGTTSVNPATGVITYTPNPNFTGTDSFIYQACDSGTPLPAQCDTAVVTITVTPVNDPPIARPDNATTNEDTPVPITVLTNDSDVDGSLLPNTVTIGTAPANGTVSVNNVTGVITYTPNPNFTGNDSFIYQVCDNGTPLPSLCDTAIVRITVNAVNDAPVAVNDVNTTPEETAVNGNVATNDTDLDGPTLTFTNTSSPTNGTLVFNSNGTYTYTPNTNFTGTDGFTYQVCDGGTPNLCATATVTITVTPVNDPPIAIKDVAATNEDTPVVINVLANDTDIDGTLVPGTVASVTPPANGTININALTGQITYTPNPNFTGTDTFIYQVCDNGTPLPSLCDTAVVTVTINPVNDAPVAVNDVNTTPEETPVSGNVAPNDSDVDGPGATYTLVTGPSNGTLTLNNTGTYTYTPATNFTGTDVFTYSLCDGGTPNLCDTATVTITVTPINDAPIANPDNATTPEDTPVVINVPGNDTDIDGTLVPGSVTIGTQPTNGTVTVNGVTGGITYTPNPNFTGTDTFVYQICDNGTPLPSLCDTALVTVIVTPVNDAPVAVNDVNSTPEETPVSGDVSTNDSDVDGPGETFAVVTGPANGTVVLNANGTYTYTPGTNFTGTDVFTYSLCDGGTPNLCDTATVTITVTPINDAPVANPDNTTTPEDVPVTITVLANDSDVDGSLVPNTVTVGTQPANGTVSINNITGTITYTPNPNFTGTDAFIYQVCDNGTPLPSLCDTALVTVIVTPANDAPVANPDVNTTVEDTPVNGDVSPNDSDVDGPGGTYTVVTPPANGTVTLNPNGTYTYEPDTNFTGTDVFTYQLCDGGTPNLCDTATVTITVTPVNDPPIAVDDVDTTPEDVPVYTFVLGNDSDVDGSLVTTSVAIVTPPTNGTVSVNPATGVIMYTPNLDYNGTDTYSYIVCDNGTPLPSLCDTAVVTITITPVNDPVIVTITPITTNEDTPSGTICYPINDDPADDHTATLCGVTNGTATVSINNGTDQLCVTFTPNANYYGPADICVTVCDNGIPGDCDTIHIPVTVLPINDAPVANPDNATTPEDIPVVITVMGNDSDIDGALLPNTVAIGTQPTNGTVTVNAVTGEITYTPNPNFTGTDTFIYQVCDNGTPLPGLCDTALVTVIVTPVNDAPVAVNDVNTTTEETPVSGDVSTNDSDVDGPGETFAVVTGPANGTVVLNTNGTYTYTPGTNFTGTDVFTYSLCDGGTPNLCDTAVVTITVTPINDAPVANPDNTTTPEDVPVTITVLANDSDVDGSLVPNTVTVGTQPANGTVSINNITGTITYTPNPNFTGTDTFIYQVCDNGTPLPPLCDTALVTVIVTPVNDAPVAVNDVNTTPEDTPVSGDVSTNDSDVDGPVETFTVVTGPTNGSVTLNTNGTYTYTPATNYTGTDVFTYSLCDGGTPNLCDTATVTITVTPVNDPPIANPDSDTTNEDTPVVITVLTNDSDVDGTLVPNTVTVGTQPANGTVSINNITGTITYTPNPNFTGTDTFIYQVCDNGTPLPSLCDTALVTVLVNPVNDAPVANPDNATTPEDTPVVINVPGNDTDVDGNLDNTTVSVVTPPTNGTVTVNPTTGVVTYTPNPNFNGTDVFTYNICDTGMPVLCDTAVVTINVTPVNDPPVIDLPNDTTSEDTPVTICTPITDPDVGNTYTATLCGGPNNGTVSGPTVFNGQLCLTYTPSTNFNGTDSICVIVCDNQGACDTSTTVIVVTPVNDPPVANPDNATTPEDTPVTINVPGNDTDVDGNLDNTTVSVVTPPTNGTVTVNPTTGVVTYTPNPNYNGTDVFTYNICDTGMPVLCDTAVVTINITPVNDPPVIDLPNDTTTEDTPVTICTPITDPDAGNTYTATLCGGPNNGTVSGPTVFNGQLCLTYTPSTNFNGTDSICVIVCDNQGACDTSTTVIVVTPVNDPPVANPDNATTPEDTPVTINVPGNDTDVDGNLDNTTVSVVTPPTNGTVTVNPTTGVVTYTPNPNFNGTDVFTYNICDTGTPVYCDTTTVTITVTPVNDPPVFDLPNDTTNEDTPITICAPITDPDVGNVFSAALCGGPYHGTVSAPVVFNGQVCITYTPALNYNGLDSICVTVCDNLGACTTSTTVITVVPVNDPPVANPDNATTPEDTPVTINVPGNDTDVDGNLDNTTVSVVTPPTNGTVTVNPTTGVVTYTPNPNFNGTDVFTYSICDMGSPVYCDTAVVTINVLPVNDPPVIDLPDPTTPEETPVTICSPITDPDAGNTFTATLCGGPFNGTVTGPTVFNGQVCMTYTPNTNFNGLDSVCVIVCDNFGACDTGTTVITVTPVNDPPVANDDTDSTTTGTPVVIDVTNNDTDVDGNIDPTTVTITVPPTQGTVTVDPVTGVVTYTPNANACGIDNFTYQVCDDGTPLPALCDQALVTVVIVDTEAPVIAGCPTSITLNNDPGVCGAVATWPLPTATDNCAGLTLGSNYASGFTFPIGTTTVIYIATDAAGNADTCRFAVTVTDTEAPVFANCPTDITVNNLFNTCYAQVYWPTVLATDNCGNGNVVITSTHLEGEVFPVGTTPVTYTVTDAAGNSSTCTFNVTVLDTQVPTLQSCPANVTVNNTPGACGANVTWALPTVFDNCPGAVLVGSHTSGSFFAIGTDTVTYVVTDAAGHADTCSFTITVVDAEAPAIVNCPTNITVSNDAGVCGANVSWTAPTITDNCPGVTVTSTHNPGNLFAIGTTTVTYTATDAAGHVRTCTFTVTVNDTEAPTIANCPTNINVQAGAACAANVSWTAPTITDNCAGTTVVASHNPGDAFAVGTTTVTYTATDASGNISVCTFTVTVTDTVAPTVANCPANITMGNGFNLCGALVNWTVPTFTDNCGTPIVTATHTPGMLFPLGTTTVTYTATDAGGNIATCSFTVTVNDTQAPQITACPPNIILNSAPGTCQAVATWVTPLASDNCPGVVLSSTHTSGATFNIGTTTVTYTATDAAGLTSTCSFTVTVVDTQAPLIAGCPSNISVSTGAGVCTATVNWTAPTATDNCSAITWTNNHNPGDMFPLGNTTVTYTATDAAGNVSTCSFVVTVTDTEAPVIAGCPANISVAAGAACAVPVTWTAPTATDNCTLSSFTSTHNSGDNFPVGVTTVTYTATDAAGYTTTCSFTVTVTDNVTPTITNCPTNITVSNNFNMCGALANWTLPTITDNCGTPTVTSTHMPGFMFPVGTTTVTYTATDVSGNVSTCTFTVTVNDTQAPQISVCPPNLTLNTAPGTCSAVATWVTPSAYDNCSGVVLTATHNTGDTFPTGTTTVTYVATDAAGNTGICSFTVTVVDTEAPVITNCPSNISVSTVAAACNAPVSWTAPTATDNCSAITWTSNHNPGDVFPLGNTTVTYTATDADGNVSTCTFTVTVTDNVAPVIANCPTNISINNTAGTCGATVTWTAPTATDNCTLSSFTSTHTSGSTFAVGTTTVTYTATDAAGNASTCSFTVTVTDTQAPVLTGCPANVTVNAAFNTCGAPILWTPPTFTDNCPGMTVTTTHLPGTTFSIGTTTVTYTATDISGNVTTCTFTVTVNDVQAPAIASCPIDVTINSTPGICGAAYNWVLPTVFDNCPGTTLTTTHAPGSTFAVGNTTVTYTATDASGNTATCSFVVTVKDAEAPVITGCPANITVSNDPGNCDGTVTWQAPTATDNCGVDSFTSTHNPGDVFPVGVTTVTYTATDTSGNVTTCVFTVTVNDTELPVITGCPADITVNNTVGVCESVVTWTAPTATDNCNNGFTFVGSHTPGDVFPVGTTTVTYVATDAAGNTDTCSFNVTVVDAELPVITGCPANIASCTDTITWTAPTASDNCGVASFTSNYNPGDVFPVGTTTVIYTALDSAGNVTTCSFDVTVSMPVLTLVYADVTCNGLNDGTATVLVSNAVAPLTFNWSNSGTDSTVTGLAPGTYHVTVTDGIGCMAADTVSITEPAVFSVTLESVSVATCGFEDANAIVSTTGGNKPYSYAWSNGQATESLYNVADGIFSLVATDAKGCQDSLTVTVTCEFGKVPQLITPNGDNHNDVWFIPGIDKYPDAVVEVYNRWGNIVFKASPYKNDWAGMPTSGVANVGSGKLPAGTYFYVITLNKGDKGMTGYVELEY